MDTVERMVAACHSSQWRDLLSERLNWRQQPVVQVYGRRHPVPRMTVFLAAEGLHYRYSRHQAQREGVAAVVHCPAEIGE